MRAVAPLWPSAMSLQRVSALLFLMTLSAAIAQSQQQPPLSPPAQQQQQQQQQQQFREYRPPSPSSGAGWRGPSAGSHQASGEWRPQGSGPAPQRYGPMPQRPAGQPPQQEGRPGPFRPVGPPLEPARPGSPQPSALPPRPGAGQRPPQPAPSGERRPLPPPYPGGSGPAAPARVADERPLAASTMAPPYTGKSYPAHPTPPPLAPLAPVGPNVTRAARVVCYYTNWAQKRAFPSMFYPEDIDPNMCTHINFAFARVSQHALQPTTWNDIDMYARIQNLKLKNPSLKVLLSVGGWNHGTKNFTEAAYTPSSRATFVQNVVAYLRQYGFDGLDLVWIYPGAGNSPPEDKRRFTFLVQELRDAFDHEASLSGKTGFLLTAAVSANEVVVNRAYEIERLAECLDWVNLMTYDMRTANQTLLVQPHSSLYGPPGDPFTVDYAVRMWIANGMPARKVVIGVPMYGRSFRLAAAANHEVNANAVGAGDLGWYTISPGFQSYFEICQDHDFLRNEMFDMLRRVPYSWNRKLDWIGYESPRSMIEKCHFVQGAGIGGVMVWTLDLDDFSGGFCNAGKYPLLRELSSCLIMSLGSRYQQAGQQQSATAAEGRGHAQSWSQPRPAAGQVATGSQAQQPLQLQPMSPAAVRPQSPLKPLGAETAGVSHTGQHLEQPQVGAMPQSGLAGFGQPAVQQPSAASFRQGEAGVPLTIQQSLLGQHTADMQRQPIQGLLSQMTKPLWAEKEGERVVGAAKLSAAVLIQEGDAKSMDESQAYGKHRSGGKKPLLSVLETTGGKEPAAIACTDVFICPSSAGVGDLYSDPCDCTKFYECNDSVAVRRSCPKQWAWESSSKRCKHYKEVTSCHADFTLR